jgi:hypothetical protein
MARLFSDAWNKIERRHYGRGVAKSSRMGQDRISLVVSNEGVSSMRIALATLPVLLVAGCAATIPPAQVTRFHLNQPIAPGTFALEPGIMELEASSYRAAVSAEFQKLGFRESGDGARYLVSVGSNRDEREAAPRRSPVTIGIGGGTGGYGGGVGLGASFGLGGNRSRIDVVTKISVRLVERASGATVWEGRAETVAPLNAPAAQPGLAAQKLAAALFRGFPGESGRTISVP